MIKLSRLADYSIVLMTQLAARPGSLVRAPDMALVTGLPVPTVAKTLKRLAHAGLVESQRGAKGGYALARAASEISVASIIEALEGPIAMTECVEESEEGCSYEATCRVRSNWQRINQAVSGALEGITLEEMAEPWKRHGQVPAALRGERAAGGGTGREVLVSIGA